MTQALHWLGDHWRDLLDVLGVVATVVAAWLAWLAIRSADKQAQRSAEMVRRERRLDFELDKLQIMWDLVRDATQEVPYPVKMLMRFMPHGELPRLSAQCKYSDAPQWAMTELQRLDEERDTGSGWLNSIFPYQTDEGVEYQTALLAEIESAIESRIAARETS